ncbi:hypothetical protein ACQEU3_45540 [Spirillospora sp. CA-253888]
MAYDASQITALEGLEAVRRRPQMFFGVKREDPALLAVAFSLAVQDALVEAAPAEPLRVRVEIDGPRSFAVQDNGPGLPVEPVRPGGLPAVTEMTTVLMGGPSPVRRWGMAMVAALCSDVVVDVWRGGRHHRQVSGRTGIKQPLEALEVSDLHGTRIAYRFDDDCLAASAELPADLSPLLESMFLLPHHDAEVPRPAPGTSIDLADRRHGVQAVLTHRA